MHELNWGLPVILYLFLAGVGAGAVTVSSSVLLRGGGGIFGGNSFAIARAGALVGPLPVILGTTLIVFELGQPFRALNLFKLINLSPMNIGSWLLGLFMTISVLYALAFVPTFFPKLKHLDERLKAPREALAWICVPLGLGVAVYTGVMLGAMPARPLWNSPVLAFLFMISALSTGVAMITLSRTLFHQNRLDSEPERRIESRRDTGRIGRRFIEGEYVLTASDLLLIGMELMIIFLFIMFAHLTVGDVKHAAAVLLPGGDLATMFWLGVVLVGLALPALAELIYVVPKLVYHRQFSVPRRIEIAVATAVLFGGFALRYVVVVAGQVTSPVTL